MITAQQFAQAVDDCAEDIREYEWGADGFAGKCDCIGLIMDALSLLGFQWPGTHGTNWTARNAMRELKKLTVAGDLFLGEVVFKARAPRDEKYKLPDSYKNSGDLFDYYHVGVVTAVNPLCITHCTDVPGGIQRDTKLGAWAWGGRLKYVNYDEEGSEESMDFPYLAAVYAPNKYPVKMREEPNQDANILEKVALGTRVDVLAEIGTEEDGKWCFIRHGERTGDMMKKFLRDIDEDQESVPEEPGEVLLENAERALEKAQEAILEALEAVRAAKGETEA